ncbi:MAG: hypothetical protein JO182_22980 [Acidobacteriaceae bacterium]|nr:hypothetical protein [Acidobacteriaceae bacterium]MBV9222971.1 hypothetical protein [Acidobacteriaceae bacterium]MBV9679365.1 hypothetical protein [Acidobacteriaceae bacterium]
MRTTVRLDEALLTEAKKLAVDTNRTLTAVIEDALQEVVRRRRMATLQKSKITLPVFTGRGLRPGVDLDNSSAVLDITEGLP